MMTSDVSVVWFRRDLRLDDHPAIAAAARSSDRLVPVFVLDPVLLEPAGTVRRTVLYRCLRALDTSMGGALLVLAGAPADALSAIVSQFGVRQIHVTGDYGPYGRRRDHDVGQRLAAQGCDLVSHGSPYAVDPGTLRTGAGKPYSIFSPFYRAWLSRGWPASVASRVVARNWLRCHDAVSAVEIPPDEATDATLPEVGEDVARRDWAKFRADGLSRYAEERDAPARRSTSRMSVHLKYGALHPRTLLSDLADLPSDSSKLQSELAWRDFYADVLYRRPDSARETFDRRFDALPVETDTANARRDFDAWATGHTGFPIVDAGMRQLLQEAWMHNRVRMITASFLVKDLHLPWQWGARHFMRHLADGDLASNQHGWQWVAGSGTDPAPYFRVFNPTLQGKKFDPAGDYVRRYVPELADVPAAALHQPWSLPGGPPSGYPSPIVDHATERAEALLRYGSIR